MSILAGSVRIAPRLKLSFERAREEAGRRHLPAIDPVALLLGMVEVDDAIANRILGDLGVDREHLRQLLRGEPG